jgi:hypothetical protein
MQRVGCEALNVLKRAQMPSHKAPRIAATERKLQALVGGDEATPDGDAVGAIQQYLMHASYDCRPAIGVERWCRISFLPSQRRRFSPRTRRLKQARLASDTRLEAR